LYYSIFDTAVIKLFYHEKIYTMRYRNFETKLSDFTTKIFNGLKNFKVNSFSQEQNISTFGNIGQLKNIFEIRLSQKKTNKKNNHFHHRFLKQSKTELL
jgi:hypothetical protein